MLVLTEQGLTKKKLVVEILLSQSRENHFKSTLGLILKRKFEMFSDMVYKLLFKEEVSVEIQ